MTDREIALQLTLKLIETNQIFSGDTNSNEDLGREVAKLFNEICKGICQE